MNNDVTVIGLGAMGSALARVLLEKGYRVTVWNRTGAKAQPLLDKGAILAPSPAAAVKASPLVLVCVQDYQVSQGILETEGAAAALTGKILVQMNTGTPRDARDAEAWAHRHGAGYLDAAIMATPSQMGRPETPLFVSGAKTALQQSEPALRALAGNIIYTGGPISHATAWDLGVLSYAFGGLLGFFHGARIFESEGLPVGDLGATIARISPFFGEMAESMGQVIQAGNYENPQASVKTCTVAFELFIRHAREAGISAEFPLFALDLCQRAMAAGYGEEEFAAIAKVLRGAGSGVSVHVHDGEEQLSARR